MAKTLFAADAALDGLLAASGIGKKAAPASASKATPQARAKKAQARKKAPRPTNAASEPPEARRQLNAEVGASVMAAIDLRRARARLSGDKAEDSCCKIVDAALRAHLADELALVSSALREQGGEDS